MRDERTKDRPLRLCEVLLWWPKPTETFIFYETLNLRRLGARVLVVNLYGRLTRGLSESMRAEQDSAEHLGLAGLWRILTGFLFWMKRSPGKTLGLFPRILFRRWGDLEKTGENVWCFFGGFHLARRCFEHDVEHIHSPWALGTATAAWVAAELTGVPFSFTGRAHDIFPPDGALRDKIAAAAFVRAESGSARVQITRFAGPHALKIRTLPNGLPPIVESPAAPRFGRPLHLLAVGRFVDVKGFDVLVKALARLVTHGLNVRLVLAGEGPRARELTVLARRLGVHDRIEFPGHVPHDRVSTLYQAADLFIMPCRVDGKGNRDGLPTVLLEALAHGLPVIATPVSGVPELIEDGRTGLLVPPEDPDALAAAVERLAADPDAALALAEAGRQAVLAGFDPETNHRILLDWLSAHRRNLPNARPMEKRP